MNFKIKKIILWPKKSGIPKREIEFKLDEINIIVGDSQTGKSAIIPIIDYCLGSDKCTIPTGPIREYTAWFGVLVAFDKTELLLARPDPGIYQSTSTMFYDEAVTVKIPDAITESNSNRNIVVNRMNQLSKLPNVTFTDDSNPEPYEGRPSFRDFVAFVFQPQHIVANPFTLYYKADTIEHRMKLKTIFPLALGLITAESLETQRRLNVLREELKKLVALQEEKVRIRTAFFVEIKSSYIKALELGLLTDAPFPGDDWSLNEFLPYVRQIPQNAFRLPRIEVGTSNKVIHYINMLQQKEKDILDLLDEKKFKLQLVHNYNDSSRNYTGALLNQRSRLEYVTNGWLTNKKSEKCPVCGSDNHDAKEDISNLVRSFNEVSRKLTEVDLSKDILSKEVTQLEKEIIELESQLNNVNTELELLSARYNQIEQRRRSFENAYKFVGRVEQSLKNIDDLRIDGNLLERIAYLDSEIKRLEGLTQANSYSMRLDDALRRISIAINHYKQLMMVENFENPTNIDIKELTLIISSKTRRDYLWEIGSGSNWLGYHVAAILSLQEYFLKLPKKNNHVPSFVVFDQPSQAYFPEMAKKGKSITIDKDSDDYKRVNSIFKSFSSFMTRTKNNCQVIVLEHASPDFWGDVPNTYFVEGHRWTRDTALIPKEWMD